jgi:HK97 family phage portal protein
MASFFDRLFTSSTPPQEVVDEVKSFDLSNITNASDLATLLDIGSTTNSLGDFDYEKNLRQAYLNNVISFYCLNLITSVAIQPRWELYVNDAEVVDERSAGDAIGIYRFMQRPSWDVSLNEFIKQYLTYFYLAGEVFVYRLPNNNAIRRGNGKFLLIEPSNVTINKNEYIIRVDDDSAPITVPKQNRDGTRDILHVRQWHPSSKRGMSHLTPAWLAISNYNKAQQWNHAVLSNSAKLSLIAVLKTVTAQAAKGGTLTKEQMNEINRDLTKFTTGNSRGKPFVVSGDWDFKELGLNQQELEFISGMEHMARNIALAYGVDPVLLSLPGDSTYNNKKEAVSSLFKLTVLPQLQALIGEFSYWMKEVIPGDWEIRLNYDDIPALATERALLWDQQTKASDILTVNERRALLGYEPIVGGDVLSSNTSIINNSSNQTQGQTNE